MRAIVCGVWCDCGCVVYALFLCVAAFQGVFVCLFQGVGVGFSWFHVCAVDFLGASESATFRVNASRDSTVDHPNVNLIHVGNDGI